MSSNPQAKAMPTREKIAKYLRTGARGSEVVELCNAAEAYLDLVERLENLAAFHANCRQDYHAPCTWICDLRALLSTPSARKDETHPKEQEHE